MPSGENATEATGLLCAFSFLLTRSSVAAWEGSGSQQEVCKGNAGAVLGQRLTGIPDFDRLIVRSGHDLGPVWGKRHRLDPAAVGVCLLGLQLECTCQGSQKSSDLAKEGRFWAEFAPESQTLIVLSTDPETILLPSGENATDKTSALCAFVFSLFRSSVAARQATRGQFWPRRGDFRPKTYQNPRL